jgi:cytidylate kinase
MKYQSIVFSGLPGAGKSTLAKTIGQLYGWPVYSAGGLWRTKWSRLYPNGEVDFDDYWRSTSAQENLKVDRDFRNIAIRGRVVGDVRYTINLLGLPILLVFLSADLDTRSQRALGLDKYKDMSMPEIRKVLARRESDEAAASGRLYGYDYRDSSYYHLAVNTAMLSREEVILLIKTIVSE